MRDGEKHDGWMDGGNGGIVLYIATSQNLQYVELSSKFKAGACGEMYSAFETPPLIPFIR